jgi:hypothetical protein
MVLKISRKEYQKKWYKKNKIRQKRYYHYRRIDYKVLDKEVGYSKGLKNAKDE